MELLQAGVDRSVIALWLGHESIETPDLSGEIGKQRGASRSSVLSPRRRLEGAPALLPVIH
jgi:site-specific recombinase XerD